MLVSLMVKMRIMHATNNGDSGDFGRKASVDSCSSLGDKALEPGDTKPLLASLRSSVQPLAACSTAPAYLDSSRVHGCTPSTERTNTERRRRGATHKKKENESSSTKSGSFFPSFFRTFFWPQQNEENKKTRSMNLASPSGTGPHALSLHVARLARPSFDFDAPLRLDLANDFDGKDASSSSSSDATPFSSSIAAARAQRSLRSDPLDALEGVPGLLSLRSQFGAVYLGEPFFAALSLVAAEAVVGGVGGGPGGAGEGAPSPPPSSSSSSPSPSSSSAASFAEALAGGGASDVALRVELTADGDGKGAAAAVLADTAGAPIALLAPGQRHDCLLRHDVRCVGRHTLVAAASYTVPATGERRHLSQYFSFSAAAPLGVRTKVRPAPARAATAKGGPSPHPPRPAVLVEATIDNSRRGQCLSLELPTFEASQGLEAALVSISESCGSEDGSPASSPIPPPPPPPIPPNGAASFVWVVGLLANGDAASLAAAAASPAGLGRLDLRWRTPFGGAGRLQTQGIAPPPSASRRVSLGLKSIDSASAPLERPFEVVLSVTSRVDAAVGPLRLEAAAASSSVPSSSDAAGAPPAAAAAAAAPSTSSSSSIVLLGPPTRQVTSAPLPPLSNVSVAVTLLALQPGVQRLPALRLVDGSDGSTLDILSGWVMVS